MPGFMDFTGVNRLRRRLVDLSKFGMKWDDLLIKNSQAIGFIEGEMRKKAGMGVMADDLLKYSMAISDTTSQLRAKTLAFFQLDYVTKREKLRDVSSNAEIEFVLDNISNDAIVMDSDNFFCRPTDLRGSISKRKGVNSQEMELRYEDKIIEMYDESFHMIYNAWGFNTGNLAWQMFYQWLIEGHLCYEILYDNLDKPKEIIGFKELDPATLYPVVQKDNYGKIYLEWIQRDDSQGVHRTMADSQVIYLSYSNSFRTKRVSFVERMVRSFNLLRILEHSKVIWHVMHAPIRLKTTVPIGTKSIQKAREDINEFLNTFKEDIFFDQTSGELQVDGKPKVLFYKNYVIPVNDKGEQVDINTLEYQGPNMQDDSLLNYFLKKLKLDSKLPFARWDYNEGGGSYLLGPDTVNREEIAYSKFIGRLRSAFQEIILKPWYLQMCLKHDGLRDDYRFKNSMGLKFENDNVFELMKKQELLKKGAETIEILKSIKKDAEDDAIPTEWAMREHLDLDDHDFDDISRYWEKSQRDAEEAADAAAEAGGGEEAGLEEGGLEEGEEEGGPLEGAAEEEAPPEE